MQEKSSRSTSSTPLRPRGTAAKVRGEPSARKREPQTFKQVKVPTGPMIGGSLRELFGRGSSRLAD